jgi:hypothetical protein
MLDIIVLLMIISGLLLVVLSPKKRTSSTSSTKPKERTMLLAHNSTDIVSESYLPAIKDMSMPFPIGKRKERKKTETFRRHSDG